MNDPYKKYLVPIFGVFIVLFNYPIFAIFDRIVTIGGIPLIITYLFVAWLIMILSLAYIMESKKR